MTKKYTYSEKSNGQTLSAEEWNNLAQDVDAAVDAITNIQNNGSGGSGNSVVSTEIDPLDANKTFVKVGDVTVAELTSKGDKGTNVGLSGNNNINIEPRPAAGDGSGKNTPGLANRKGGNIALKPGDDIEFWGHKRGTSKSDEVSVKIMTEVPKASDPTKTDEVAAKLQLNAGDIVLTSKDKVEESDVMNITVNKAANTRGYLKVRAQAIDLRCENTPGGIALQPNGVDSDGHMNKIKFEHGGGDGLEFGTFNTEHTSLFTDDYRFNKYGEIKLATRKKVYSDKTLSFEFNNSGESNNPIATQYSVTQNVAQITPAQDITVGGKYSIIEIAEMFAGLDIMTFQNWYETNKPVMVDILCDGGTHFFFTAALSLKSYGPGDTSTHYEYLKNSEDDFYDFVDDNYSCTWKDVVKTAETFGDMISGRYKVKTYTSGNIVYTFDFSNENVANPFESVKKYTSHELLNVMTDDLNADVAMQIQFANIQNSITHGDWICIELYNNETVYLQYTESENVFSYRKNSYFENADNSENIKISDMISILNELKDMKDNNQGPWAGL